MKFRVVAVSDGKEMYDELDMNKLIFSSRWNRYVSVFKNGCIDLTMHEGMFAFKYLAKFF